MPLLTSLLLLLVTARLFGEVFRRLKQPSLLGEIFAGILLGPSCLDVVRAGPALSGISELAVFLIILSAGLEMEFKDVISAFRGRGFIVALFAFLLPFAGGTFVGSAFGQELTRSIFLGLCVSITALPVAIRILDGFGLLRSEIGRYAVASAVVNDVIALLALGVILDLPEQKSAVAVVGSMGLAIAKLLLLALLVFASRRILSSAQDRGLRVDWIPEKLTKIFGEEALFGLVVGFVLVFASISELLGTHFVIGAFFGALLLNPTLFLKARYRQLERILSSVTGGFLAPIFFAFLGLEFEVATLQGFAFIASVLSVSVATKLLAGYLGGVFVGMRNREAIGLGIILNGRGIMELVVANIAFQRGFIDSDLFSTLVLMGLFTTAITPFLFGRVLAVPTEAMNGDDPMGSSK